MKVGDELSISAGFRIWDGDEFEEPPLCKGVVTRVSRTGATIRPYYKDGKKWKQAGRPYVISNNSELRVLRNKSLKKTP